MYVDNITMIHYYSRVAVSLKEYLWCFYYVRQKFTLTEMNVVLCALLVDRSEVKADYLCFREKEVTRSLPKQGASASRGSEFCTTPVCGSLTTSLTSNVKKT